MEKFIITWSCGFGDSCETIEAVSRDAAVAIAAEYAREEAESVMDYSAEIWTEELAEEHDVE